MTATHTRPIDQVRSGLPATAASDGEPMTIGRARAFVALGALALGGFGVGASEFVSMGLLPQISQGLLGDLFAADPQAATARAGWLIGAYALGVVVGAPVIAVAAGRASRSRLTVGLLLTLALGTFASALAPTFESVLAARFVAGPSRAASSAPATRARASQSP